MPCDHEQLLMIVQYVLTMNYYVVVDWTNAVLMSWATYVDVDVSLLLLHPPILRHSISVHTKYLFLLLPFKSFMMAEKSREILHAFFLRSPQKGLANRYRGVNL